MDTIRAYRPDDSDACIELFDANMPTFFNAEERPDFVWFLTHHAASWHYQVVERTGDVVGCAGYAFTADGTTASLCWGMVHPQLHRQGVGTTLLLARLEALRLRAGIEKVVLDTSQHTQGFYVRNGFVVQQVGHDARPNGAGMTLLKRPAG